MGIIDHVDLAVNDLRISRDFYTRVPAPLDIVPLVDIRGDDGCEGTGFGADDIAQFWIGEGERLSGRLHVGFRANSPQQIDAFHACAIAAGGEDRGVPGFRPNYGKNYYAAFVTDPDGRIVEAVCRKA